MGERRSTPRRSVRGAFIRGFKTAAGLAMDFPVRSSTTVTSFNSTLIGVSGLDANRRDWMKGVRSMTYKVVVLTALAAGLAGCAYPMMQPPVQLESEKFVANGALDLPGTFFVPRAGVQAFYGIAGVSDVGIHVSSSLLLNSAGLSLRLYPTESLIFSMQNSYMLGIADFSYPTLHATGRLGTSTNPDRIFYGGAQSTYHNFTAGGFDAGIDVDHVLTTKTYAGIHIPIRSDLFLQAETLFNVLSFDMDQEAELM